MCWPISGAEVFGVMCLGTRGCLKLERLVLVFVWGDLGGLGSFHGQTCQCKLPYCKFNVFSSCRTSDW